MAIPTVSGDSENDTVDNLSKQRVKEEEGEYENASYHYGGNSEHATGHNEEGYLFQPLGEGANISNKETGAPLGEDGFEGASGTVRDVKGGPGGGCARSKNCKRQHEIWSKAGGNGPSIEQEAGKLWHEIKCGVMTVGQLGAEETTVGHAMAEHGELQRRKC